MFRDMPMQREVKQTWKGNCETQLLLPSVRFPEPSLGFGLSIPEGLQTPWDWVGSGTWIAR